MNIFFQKLKKATQNLEAMLETGNVSGTFTHSSRMKPAWLLIKETTQTRNWVLYDNKRVGYNPNQYEFLPDTENVEDTSTTKVDLLSNGFKIRASHSTVNQSGETYIYMAFAESAICNMNRSAYNGKIIMLQKVKFAPGFNKQVHQQVVKANGLGMVIMLRFRYGT